MKDDGKLNKEIVKVKSYYSLSISKKKEKESFKIIDINRMFYGCKSLSSLPDISKWNINNVTDMSYMFYECSSLKSLPEFYEKRIKY